MQRLRKDFTASMPTCEGMSMGKIIDLTGQRFGRLTVIEKAGVNKHHASLWKCQCDCGGSTVVAGSSLKIGNTRSCGCIQRKRTQETLTTHCGSGTRLHRIWKMMKQRCYNKNSADYMRYGGRGITICDEWLNNFAMFQEWSYANGYREYLTIDRIDNDKGYSPDNCRWATEKEQANNRHKTITITYQGETKPLTYWAELKGIPYSVLKARILKYDWPIERAMTEQIHKRKG